MPHPWFHLLYSEQEKQYIKSLKLTNTKLYIINGNNTFLDYWAKRYWQDENIEFSFAESSFTNDDKSIYLNIIDNFVLRVKLDENITNEIEKLYQTVNSFDDLEFSELFRIFGQKVKASMWLENNPKKAAVYRKRFERFFGVNLQLRTDSGLNS